MKDGGRIVTVKHLKEVTNASISNEFIATLDGDGDIVISARNTGLDGLSLVQFYIILVKISWRKVFPEFQYANNEIWQLSSREKSTIRRSNINCSRIISYSQIKDVLGIFFTNQLYQLVVVTKLGVTAFEVAFHALEPREDLIVQPFVYVSGFLEIPCHVHK